MCGRYTLTTPVEALQRRFEFPDRPELPARYNIAPGQEIAIVRRLPEAAEERRQLALVRWGLVPHWAEDPSIGNRLINARAESVAHKAAFRAAFRRRRCLIPADGFYEWCKTGTGRRQPYLVRRRDRQPFALAGL